MPRPRRAQLADARPPPKRARCAHRPSPPVEPGGWVLDVPSEFLRCHTTVVTNLTPGVVSERHPMPPALPLPVSRTFTALSSIPNTGAIDCIAAHCPIPAV